MAVNPPTVAAIAAVPSRNTSDHAAIPAHLPARFLVDDRADDRHEDQRNDHHFQQTDIDAADDSDPPQAPGGGFAVEQIQEHPETDCTGQSRQNQNIEGDLFPLQNKKADNTRQKNTDIQYNHNATAFFIKKQAPFRTGAPDSCD